MWARHHAFESPSQTPSNLPLSSAIRFVYDLSRIGDECSVTIKCYANVTQCSCVSLLGKETPSKNRCQHASPHRHIIPMTVESVFFKARASDQAITTCEANTPNPLLKRRSNILKPAQVNKCIPAVTSCIAQGLLLPLKGLEGLVGPMGPAP